MSSITGESPSNSIMSDVRRSIFSRNMDQVQQLQMQVQSTFQHPRLAITDEPVLLTLSGSYTDDQLYAIMNYLIDYWTPDPDITFQQWCNQSYDLSPGEKIDPFVLETRYKNKAKEAVIAYNQMLKNGMIGDEDDIRLENRKIMGRIMESITFAYYAVEAERRCHDAMDFKTSINYPPDVSIFRFSSIDSASINSPYQNLIIYLLRVLYHRGYRKYKGMYYEEIIVGGHHTHAWKPVVIPGRKKGEGEMTIKRFVYSAIKKENNYAQWYNLTSSKGNIKEAIEYLSNSEDMECPNLCPDRHIWSFRDGIYMASLPQDKWSHAFLRYGRDVIPEDITSCKFFDLDFPEEYMSEKDWYNKIPTPHFQGILEYQKLHEKGRTPGTLDENGREITEGSPTEVCEWMYINFGRLMFDVGELDYWQFMLFIKGIAQSGKSTLGRHSRKFYEAADVATLSATIEERFGLWQILDKFMFICYEVKEKMRLSQADLQSMITGEEVSIPIKFRQAETHQWIVPGIFMGNEVASWIDTQGSMSRRLVLVEFLERVVEDKANPNLLKDLESEMAHFMIKCVIAYKSMAKLHGDKDIWHILPPYFHETKRKMKTSLNPLVAFITNKENFEIAKDRYCHLQEFQNRYTEFVRSNFPSVKVKFNSDHYTSTFDEHGLSIEYGTKFWNGEKKDAFWIMGIGLNGGYRMDDPMAMGAVQDAVNELGEGVTHYKSPAVNRNINPTISIHQQHQHQQHQQQQQRPPQKQTNHHVAQPTHNQSQSKKKYGGQYTEQSNRQPNGKQTSQRDNLDE